MSYSIPEAIDRRVSAEALIGANRELFVDAESSVHEIMDSPTPHMDSLAAGFQRLARLQLRIEILKANPRAMLSKLQVASIYMEAGVCAYNLDKDRSPNAKY